MYRLTVVYPAAPGAHFDFDYYRTSHMPLVTSLIGESVVRVEIARGVGGGDGGAAPYLAVGHIYLTNVEGLQAAMQNHGARIVGDVPNYTNIAPVVNIEALLD